MDQGEERDSTKRQDRKEATQYRKASMILILVEGARDRHELGHGHGHPVKSQMCQCCRL
jgi:hypothetical protein